MVALFLDFRHRPRRPARLGAYRPRPRRRSLLWGVAERGLVGRSITVAVDPQTVSGTETPVTFSPIENEIPTYRAISPMAIFSFLMGLLSLVTFASSYFLIAGAMAILAGAIAQRRIRRMPDALTGRGLAQAGIAMALVFCLSAVTFTYVKALKVQTDAARFAQTYVNVLGQKNLPDAYWYKLLPVQRKGKSPKKALDEFRKSIPTNEPLLFDMELGSLQRLVDDLKAGASVQFVEIENAGYVGVTPYAFAVARIDEGPESHDDEDGDDHADHDHAAHEGPTYALFHLRSPPDSPVFDWYIHEIKYPYDRGTQSITPKPIDDGHNH